MRTLAAGEVYDARNWNYDWMLYLFSMHRKLVRHWLSIFRIHRTDYRSSCSGNHSSGDRLGYVALDKRLRPDNYHSSIKSLLWVG